MSNDLSVTPAEQVSGPTASPTSGGASRPGATGAGVPLRRRAGKGSRNRPNWGAGVAVTIWLLIVAIPLYVLVTASFQTQAGYAAGGPLSLPTTFTLDNFTNAFDQGFGRYFLNTLVVTVAVVGIVVLLVPPLSYAIVRNRSRATTGIFRMFLLGLAVPASAVIVPDLLRDLGRGPVRQPDRRDPADRGVLPADLHDHPQRLDA